MEFYYKIVCKTEANFSFQKSGKSTIMRDFYLFQGTKPGWGQQKCFIRLLYASCQSHCIALAQQRLTHQWRGYKSLTDGKME